MILSLWWEAIYIFMNETNTVYIYVCKMRIGIVIVFEIYTYSYVYWQRWKLSQIYIIYIVEKDSKHIRNSMAV